ncbi:hypothetical protein [Massilia sp. ZL223]|uniref:hypothetical protein n=1 Tax=Massilia sp. ZL223 TaxID=2824904 RepID=UPI001B818BB4|nr:hypothetical protein [Massilia sp. ZL223]MBQ5965155.1 hypothetical protein [Massilia sp. ZL223]
MSTAVLSACRVLPANLPEDFRLKMHPVFGSASLDPGARYLGSGEYSLGTDSDWNPDLHNLTVTCTLGNVADLEPLFGPGGVAAADAVLLVALEWTSADSGWRRLGPPLRLTRAGLPAADDGVTLSLELPPGSVRGTGMIAVQLFMGEPGSAEVGDAGTVRQKGVRLGALSGLLCVVIDGDGSLFPVQEEELGRDGPLWKMHTAWDDPREEPFASEYVALVLNRDHELFDQLRDRRAGQNRQTPLMRHVLASWIALLVHEVRTGLGEDFDGIVRRQVPTVDFASIAEAAAAFVRAGDLDTSSAHVLFASVQQWLDRRVRETEATK